MDETMDLEKQLSDCQCHFNWDIPDICPKLELEISSYNFLGGEELTIKRFLRSLNLAYWMFIEGLDGWDKLLENSSRLMEHSRDPSCPQGLDVLPSYGSPLYAGSTQAFFYHDEIPSETNDHDMNTRHTLAQNDEDDTEEDDILESYVALEHVFYALKASILFRIGSSSSLVHQQLSRVTHFDDMTPSDRARVLFFKASTVQHTGSNGWGRAVDIMKTCVLTDPDSLKWPLLLIRYLGEKRRGEHRVIVESEIRNTVEVIDFVLQQDIKPSLRLKCQFEKFQALNELHFHVSQQEQKNMFLTCLELCEALEQSPNRRVLAYCAQFYSKLSNKSAKAVQLIEKALESHPDDVYVNAKASNVYRYVVDLNRALECAEKAATQGFGSCSQVLILKIDLKQVFDYEEFFCEMLRNYPEDIHVTKTHKTAASFYAIKGDIGLSMKHFKLLLDMCDSEDDVYAESYCFFNIKTFHLPEALYNLALLVLNSDSENDNASVEDVALCSEIKGEIEEKFDVDSFKSSKHQTPNEYVQWLRSSSKLQNIDQSQYYKGEPFNNDQNLGTRRYQVSLDGPSEDNARTHASNFGFDRKAHHQNSSGNSWRNGGGSFEAPSQGELTFGRHPLRENSYRFGAPSQGEPSFGRYPSQQNSNRFGAPSQEDASFGRHAPRQTYNRFGAPSQGEPSFGRHAPRQTLNRFGAPSQGEPSLGRHPSQQNSNRFGAPSQEDASFGRHAPRQTYNRFGAPSQGEPSFRRYSPQQNSNRFGAPSQGEPGFGRYPSQQNSNRFGAPSQEDDSFGRHPPLQTSNKFEDPSRRDPRNYANNMVKFFQKFDGSNQKDARTYK